MTWQEGIMNQRSPHVIWASAVIVLALIAGVTALGLAGSDNTTIVSLITIVAVPVLGAMLWGKVDAVRENTNGITSRLLDMNERLMMMVAVSPAVHPQVATFTPPERSAGGTEPFPA